MLLTQNQNNFYLDKDISALDFHLRVMEEARSLDHSFLERVKFVAITSLMFEEFFKINYPKITGKKKKSLIKGKVESIHYEQYDLLEKYLVKAREEKCFTLEGNVCKELSDVFQSKIVVKKLSETKLSDLDSGTVYNLVSVVSENNTCKYIVDTSALSRVYRVDDNSFYLMENEASKAVDNLFGEPVATRVSQFRLTRDINIFARTFKDNLEENVTRSIKGFSKRVVTRLEFNNYDEDIFEEFIEELSGGVVKIKDSLRESLIKFDSFIDLSFLFKVVSSLQESTKHVRVLPGMSKDSIINTILYKDVLMCHPFDSYAHITNLLNAVIANKDTKSIHITIYRANKDIIDLLCEASRAGIEVNAITDITAQFDELNNLKWKEVLTEAGCNVSLGHVGYNVHAKFMVVTFENEDDKYHISHMSTANYNNDVDSVFVDISLMSSKNAFAKDLLGIFENNCRQDMIPQDCRLVIDAPFNFRRDLFERIDNEINNAKRGLTAKVIIKCNELSDKDLIDKIISAYRYGVKFTLIVRNVCGLKPTEDGGIKVYSLVGRLLEHSRFYVFENGGKVDIIVSSIDPVTYKIDDRIDISFPVEFDECKIKMLNLISDILRDSKKLRECDTNGVFNLNCDGCYDYQLDYLSK